MCVALYQCGADKLKEEEYLQVDCTDCPHVPALMFGSARLDCHYGLQTVRANSVEPATPVCWVQLTQGGEMIQLTGKCLETCGPGLDLQTFW